MPINLNRCPKCIQIPEPEGCFRFDRVINRMRLVGWRVSCINYCFYTDVYENIDEAIAKWNELTNKIKGE